MKSTLILCLMLFTNHIFAETLTTCYLELSPNEDLPDLVTSQPIKVQKINDGFALIYATADSTLGAAHYLRLEFSEIAKNNKSLKLLGCKEDKLK